MPFSLEFAKLASEAFWEKVTEGSALKSVLGSIASARMLNLSGPQFLHLYHGSIVAVCNNCNCPATAPSPLQVATWGQLLAQVRYQIPSYLGRAKRFSQPLSNNHTRVHATPHGRVRAGWPALLPRLLCDWAS